MLREDDKQEVKFRVVVWEGEVGELGKLYSPLFKIPHNPRTLPPRTLSPLDPFTLLPLHPFTQDAKTL